MTDMKLYALIDGQYVEVKLDGVVVFTEDYGSTVYFDIDRVDDGSTLEAVEIEV